jgi:integrase
MVNQLLLGQPDLKIALEDRQDETNESIEDIVSYHNCLVASYLAYLQAAGYSIFHSNVRRMEQGAWQFLSRYPDPKEWFNFSVEDFRGCDARERSFVHYLLLRRIIPMPLTYMLAPRYRFFQMATRLMEQETYQVYQKAARRLGFSEQDAMSQFRVLLSLMIWAQKPMGALALEDMNAFAEELRGAYQVLAMKGKRRRLRHGLPIRWHTQMGNTRNVLYHMGILPQTARGRQGPSDKRLENLPPQIAATVRRYIQQMTLSLRPESVYQEKLHLLRFFSWLVSSNPEVTRLSQIQRCHIEAYKEYLRWVPLQHKSNHLPGNVLSPSSRYHLLADLYYFLVRIAEWQWPEAPKRILIFTQDFPRLDQPSPKFLDEISAAKFLQAARNHPDLFTRLCGVTLILTGMRQGEFLNLTADCMVQIGENYWLRVPIGKMHNDRYIPLHPEVKQLLDDWIEQHPPIKPFDFLFTGHGYRYHRGKVVQAVARIAKEAGIKEHVPPHRLRHTLATLAVNRGMPLESIAALLGHRSLSMTMVYARIGNRAVQQEYSQVSQHLEEICNRVDLTDNKLTEAELVEGTQMRKLRQDHWRLLGNGYCARPEGVPCEYETICESCPCFSTTVEFLPVLQKQKQDAEEKGQTQRVDVFARLIRSME